MQLFPSCLYYICFTCFVLVQRFQLLHLISSFFLVLRPCQKLRPLPPGPAGHHQIRPVVSFILFWPLASLNSPPSLIEYYYTLRVLRLLLHSPQHESLPGAHFKWELPICAEVKQNLGECFTTNSTLNTGNRTDLFQSSFIVISIHNDHINWFHEYLF